LDVVQTGERDLLQVTNQTMARPQKEAQKLTAPSADRRRWSASSSFYRLEDDPALLGHRCQSILASRLTAGESGFLLLIQCRERPE
jgi:hypothetical protein